jgi:hypothetical protein
VFIGRHNLQLRINMSLSAHSILSATTGISLTAFTTISAFTANASASVTATALGLLAIYGIVEMMILSYAPRRSVTRPARLPSATAKTATVIEFPAEYPRSCAA